MFLAKLEIELEYEKQEVSSYVPECVPTLFSRGVAKWGTYT